MDSRVDSVFGELEFKGYWCREIELTLFGTTSIVELIVDGNDDEESILDEQRNSYQKLKDFIPMAEDGILAYYNSNCDDYRAQFGDDADARMPIISDKTYLSTLTRLTGVVFPMVLKPGDISVGFLLECSWDPEHGVGVKITNGETEVGTQDLVT